MAQTATSEEMQQAFAEQQRTRRELRGCGRTYLALVLSVALVLYLLPFFLIRLPRLEHWLGSGYGAVIDYGYETAGMNADVLIVGDSSMIVGINPSLMSRRLGVKVISLPNTIGSLRAEGEMVLQRYLKANRPPQVIVLYVSPWNLDYTHVEDGVSVYEAQETMFRHGGLRDIAGFLRKHPFRGLEFPLRFYLVNGETGLSNDRHHRHPEVETAETGGYYDPLFMFQTIPGSCILPKNRTAAGPMSSAEEFLKEYNTRTTRAYVYNAPVPACSNASVLTTRSYGTVAEPPRAMKPGDFRDDPYFTHLAPSGVAEATEALGNFVQDHRSPSEH